MFKTDLKFIRVIIEFIVVMELVELIKWQHQLGLINKI